MSTVIDQYTAIRKALSSRQAAGNPARLVALPSAAETEAILAELPDHEFIQRAKSGHHSISDHDASARGRMALAQLLEDFDRKQLLDAIGACRKGIISSIAGPFGLGKLVSVYDKVGGNVDTVHNARNDVYATEEESDAYENRGDYSYDEYHGDNEQFTKYSEDQKSLRDEGNLQDGYTGKTFGEKLDPDADRQTEHVIPCKEIHNDPGRVLAEMGGADLANSDTNLTSTAGRVNSKKNQDPAERFLAKQKYEREARQKRIAELEAKEVRTPKEESELLTATQLEDVDAALVREKDEQARKDYNEKINREYYTSKKFALNTAKTSALEGGRTGFKQAFALCLTEFFVAVCDEGLDWYKNGRSSNTVIRELGRRLRKIASRVASRWKDALAAFGAGFIAGFLSNLVTVLINAFITTQKRAIRMIRQGTESMVEAVRVLVMPPKDMLVAERLHEFSKVAVGTTILIGGIALEEVVEKYLLTIPLLAPIADVLTAVIVGSLAGITTAFAAYILDRIDFFGAYEIRASRKVGADLHASLGRSIEDLEREVASRGYQALT